MNDSPPMIICKNSGCGKKFKWAMQLKRHKAVCTKEQPAAKYTKSTDGYKCSVCYKTFKHQSGISKHLKKQKCLKEKEIHQCSKCSKSFSFKCRLTEHMKSHEVESKVCVKCNKKFKRIDFFDTHVKMCSFEPQQRSENTCTNCGKTFKRVGHYEKHMRSCHPYPTFATDSISEELLECIEQMDDESAVPCSMVAGDTNDESSAMANSSINEEFNDETNDFVTIENVNDISSVVCSNLNDSTTEIDFHSDNELSGIFPIEDLMNESNEDPVVGSDKVTTFNEENLDTTSSSRKSDTDRVFRHRKAKRLEAIVQDLSSPVKANVVKQFVKGNPRVLEEIYAYTDCTNKYEAAVAEAVIKKLKMLSQEKKFGRFYMILDEFFGDKLQDDGFANWLIYKKLGLRTNRCLPRLKSWKERDFRDPRGRSRLSPEVVKKVFDMYVENSITSTDERNGRNMVKIRKRRLLEIYGYVVEHSDVKMEENESRNRKYYQANRRILTCTIHEMQQKLKDEGCEVSFGKIIDLKPFFIAYPTDKELALCLCKLCLNTRLLFDSLYMQSKKDEEEIPNSVTAFFMETCSCDKAENGYYKWSCVQQKCKNCKHNKPTSLKCSTSNETTQVSQFETTKTPYTQTDKETGKKAEKVSDKTERVISTRSFSEIYSSLVKLKTKYLMHRYQVFNDKHQWPKILATTDSFGPIYHFDYSENLTQSYKYEPQASHFNKKQYSLHCTVKHLPGSQLQYIYHFSDSKKHGFAYTSYCVNHLLHIEDDGSISVIIRCKSDNCTCQYKSRKVFNFYQNLAKKLGKTIIVYYGVSGHGKGLVDAMSAFGVKSPLRRAVVTQDFKYNCANDIKNFLEERFSAQYPEKQYFTVEPSELDELRQNKDEFIIKNCQAQHMISYFANGQVQGKINMCSCDKCLIGEFIHCTVEMGTILQNSNNESDSEGDDEADYENEEHSEELFTESVVHGDSILDSIAKGNIIALLADSSDPFYLCKVLDFGIAVAEIGDRKTNNFVSVGEQYIACQYLDLDKKRRKTKGKMHYRLLDGIVYINPAEVFVPCVTMEDDLTLSVEEFQWLCDSNY